MACPGLLCNSQLDRVWSLQSVEVESRMIGWRAPGEARGQSARGVEQRKQRLATVCADPKPRWLPRNAEPQIRLLAVLGRKAPGTLVPADIVPTGGA